MQAAVPSAVTTHALSIAQVPHDGSQEGGSVVVVVVAQAQPRLGQPSGTAIVSHTCPDGHSQPHTL